MLFPHRVSLCKYFPLAGNFSREIFFKHHGTPQGPYWKVSRWWAKKKPKKVLQNRFFPRPPKIWKICPGGKFFLEIFFWNTLGPLRYPIGRILDGGHKKNGPKKWSTIIFPLYGPLKTQKTPWRSQKCPKKFLNTWGVLTYPQRNFSDGGQKETLQKISDNFMQP